MRCSLLQSCGFLWQRWLVGHPPSGNSTAFVWWCGRVGHPPAQDGIAILRRVTFLLVICEARDESSSCSGLLFVAQCRHGIEAQGAAGWKVTGGQRDKDEQ